MTLLDDYEVKNKLRGVRIVREMLRHVPGDLLKRTGLDKLINSVGVIFEPGGCSLTRYTYSHLEIASPIWTRWIVLPWSGTRFPLLSALSIYPPLQVDQERSPLNASMHCQTFWERGLSLGSGCMQTESP